MAVTREIAITYGDFTAAANQSGANKITGRFSLERGWRAITVGFRVAVTGTTEADFATACSALESALSEPRRNLSIVFGSQGHVTLTEGTTAYDVTPSVAKVAESGDTGRSRLYDVTIAAKLPAGPVGRSGLVELTWRLDREPGGEERITISGTWTRYGANAAKAAYEAGIAARQAAIITAAGGTWELVGETITPDLDNDELTFERRLRRRLVDQSAGLIDDPSLFDTALVVGRSLPAPGDDPASGAKRLTRITLEASTYVKTTATPAEEDLDGVYASSYRPRLLTEIDAIASGAPWALVDESVRFDREKNMITVSMAADAALGVAGVIERRVSITDRFDPGNVIRKTWRKLGSASQAPSAHVWRKPVSIVREQSISERVAGASATSLTFSLTTGTASGGGTYVLRSGTRGPVQSQYLGTPDRGFVVVDRQETSEWELVAIQQGPAITGASSGPGPSRVREEGAAGGGGGLGSGDSRQGIGPVDRRGNRNAQAGGSSF